MPMDAAVDRDPFGVAPPLVLRCWERCREQRGCSVFGKELEGSQGLDAGFWPGASGKEPIWRGRR